MIQSSVLPIDFFMVLKIKPGQGFRETPDSQREITFLSNTRTPKIILDLNNREKSNQYHNTESIAKLSHAYYNTPFFDYHALAA